MKTHSRKITILIALLVFLFGMLFSAILRNLSASQFVVEVFSPIASYVASRKMLSQPHSPDVVDVGKKNNFLYNQLRGR